MILRTPVLQGVHHERRLSTGSVTQLFLLRHESTTFPSLSTQKKAPDGTHGGWSGGVAVLDRKYIIGVAYTMAPSCCQQKGEHRIVPWKDDSSSSDNAEGRRHDFLLRLRTCKKGLVA